MSQNDEQLTSSQRQEDAGNVEVPEIDQFRALSTEQRAEAVANAQQILELAQMTVRAGTGMGVGSVPCRVSLCQPIHLFENQLLYSSSNRCLTEDSSTDMGIFTVSKTRNNFVSRNRRDPTLRISVGMLLYNINKQQLEDAHCLGGMDSSTSLAVIPNECIAMAVHCSSLQFIRTTGVVD